MYSAVTASSEILNSRQLHFYLILFNAKHRINYNFLLWYMDSNTYKSVGFQNEMFTATNIRKTNGNTQTQNGLVTELH
jgi:hypothetical protein